MAGESKIKKWWREKGRERKKIKIKTWWLLILLIPLLFIDATLLRQDHIKMTELRDAVFKADEAENDEEIMRTLTELKNFVFSNIVINVIEENGTQRVVFGTGPFYLEHSYIRAANKALGEAEKNLASDANPHGNIYALAAGVCKPLAIQNGWNYRDPNFINCMMTEINKYPASDNLQDQIVAALPSTELYRHNYASPIFVPTLTGIMLLITVIIIVLVLIRFIVWIVLRLSLVFL